MLAVGKGGSAVFVVHAAGCPTGSAEVPVLENVKSAALAVELGVCEGSRWGFRVGQRQGGAMTVGLGRCGGFWCEWRHMERAALRNWLSMWVGARGLHGGVSVCQRRLCLIGGRCFLVREGQRGGTAGWHGRICVVGERGDRVHGGMGGGVGVGDGAVFRAEDRARSVRGAVYGCSSVCDM